MYQYVTLNVQKFSYFYHTLLLRTLAITKLLMTIPRMSAMTRAYCTPCLFHIVICCEIKQ